MSSRAGHYVPGDPILPPPESRRQVIYPRRRTGDLTWRELDVLTLAARGLSIAQVARDLWLSEDTIKTHLRRINITLGSTNRTHAVAIAITRGLITLDPPQKEH